MEDISLRQIVLILIAIYFIYKFIGKPIIGFIISLKNVFGIIKIKKDADVVIINFPTQEKVKRNIAEIVSMIMLFILILLMFKSYFSLVVLAGLLTTLTEIYTPILYNKYNGFYPDYLVLSKKYQYSNIHSWKKIESTNTLSFLGTNGLRFDIFVGNEYDKSIAFINSKKIMEEI